MLGRTLIALCAVSCLGLTQAPERPPSTVTSRVERYFDSIKTDPVRLRIFLNACRRAATSTIT